MSPPQVQSMSLLENPLTLTLALVPRHNGKPIYPNTAFHLDQATGLHLREIGPPTPFGMESVFPLQGRASNSPPKHQEAIFEA
jgi:hypothetical protein